VVAERRLRAARRHLVRAGRRGDRGGRPPGVSGAEPAAGTRGSGPEPVAFGLPTAGPGRCARSPGSSTATAGRHSPGRRGPAAHRAVRVCFPRSPAPDAGVVRHKMPRGRDNAERTGPAPDARTERMPAVTAACGHRRPVRGARDCGCSAAARRGRRLSPGCSGRAEASTLLRDEAAFAVPDRGARTSRPGPPPRRWGRWETPGGAGAGPNGPRTARHTTPRGRL